MPDVIIESEYVEINGVPLSTPAWQVMDLSELWDMTEARGSNRLIPYAKGRQPMQMILDEQRVVLPLLIFGEQARDGSTYANYRTGLWTNLQALKDNVVAPDATPDPGTKLIRLFAPGGLVLTGQCQVKPPLRLGRLGAAGLRATLDVIIPAGELT